jgi:hypothetical protein
MRGGCRGTRLAARDGDRDGVQRAQDLTGRLRAVGGALLEQPHDEGGERGRHGGAAPREWLGRLGDLRRERLLRRTAGERRLPGEELVGQAA